VPASTNAFAVNRLDGNGHGNTPSTHVVNETRITTTGNIRIIIVGGGGIPQLGHVNMRNTEVNINFQRQIFAHIKSLNNICLMNDS
jgi:hypothetical protein